MRMTQSDCFLDYGKLQTSKQRYLDIFVVICRHYLPTSKFELPSRSDDCADSDVRVAV
jgi:hypothetical protein